MRQIIASGGTQWEDPRSIAITRYIITQLGKPNPRICHLATASGDAESSILTFYKVFSQVDCRPSYLSLFNPHTNDIPGYLLEQDMIFVGGGSTRSMLAVWREFGLDQILREVWDRNIMLAGVSAGAMCWFEQGLTEALPGQYDVLNGLGFLKGSFCPHYNTPARRESYKNKITSGEILPGYGVEDGPALHFIEGELKRVIGIAGDQAVVYITPNGETAKEEHLPIEIL